MRAGLEPPSFFSFLFFWQYDDLDRAGTVAFFVLLGRVRLESARDSDSDGDMVTVKCVCVCVWYVKLDVSSASEARRDVV